MNWLTRLGRALSSGGLSVAEPLRKPRTAGDVRVGDRVCVHTGAINDGDPTPKLVIRIQPSESGDPNVVSFVFEDFGTSLAVSKSDPWTNDGVIHHQYDPERGW